MEKVGKLPEFTTDEGAKVSAESAQELEETSTGEETPSEATTENEPSSETKEPEKATDDADTQLGELEQKKASLLGEIEGLERARQSVLSDLKDSRGERRESKQRELDRVEQRIEQKTDDLKDLHPDDVTLIERVAGAKGYVSESKINEIIFKARKEDVLSKFLREFPEYKLDNDPDEKKWSLLKQEVSLYRPPETVEQYETLLRRAHRMVSGVSAGGSSVTVKKHQAHVASVGGGQTRKPSSSGRLSQLAETHMQGYTKEELSEIQKNLSNR